LSGGLGKLGVILGRILKLLRLLVSVIVDRRLQSLDRRRWGIVEVVLVAGGAGDLVMAAVAAGPAPVASTTTSGLVPATMSGRGIIRTSPARELGRNDGMLRLRRRRVARTRALLLGVKSSGRAVTFMRNPLLLLLVIVLVSIAMLMGILLLVVL
jgi:hypothetical protein